MMPMSLRAMAAALGGEVSGKSVLAPGPGHSAKDRSLSITPSAAAPDEFLVHSFSGDDPIACKDYVRAKLGQHEFKPNGHARPSQTAKRIVVERFDYHDAQGAVIYQVERAEFRNPDGSYVPKDGKHEKKFLLRRPDPDRPGEWISGRGCMAGVTRVPYRLPELLEALAHGRTIVIVEGEAKADLLWKWGIPATCNSEGHGSVKNWADHAKYFKAADQIIVLPDNDNPGRDHANTVAASLSERGAAIRVLDLPGLPPRGDIVDWAAGGGTVAQLHALIEREARPWAPTDPSSPLRIINLASLAGKEVPIRKWLVPEVILADQVTMLFGNGGDGKSLLALQLAVAVAAETDWIGFLPEPGSVLYCSAEDEPDEIHRRVADIIAGRDDLSFEALGGVNVIDLSTLDALLAVPQGRAGTLATTALFKQVADKVKELKPSLLVIDALADVYGGDENIRGQVRQFIGFLRHLAFEHGVTVLLIAHPSLSGMASGSGTSGSTGWNNSVRGRLYLEPAPADKGDEPDPCLRKLTIMKNNRGPKGASVPLRWERGRFVLMGGMGSFEQMAAEARDDSLFLKLLKEVGEQGRSVSPHGGRNHAPSAFSDMPAANKTKATRFKAAMERLLRDKKIAVVEDGPPSKRRAILVEI